MCASHFSVCRVMACHVTWKQLSMACHVAWGLDAFFEIMIGACVQHCNAWGSCICIFAFQNCVFLTIFASESASLHLLMMVKSCIPLTKRKDKFLVRKDRDLGRCRLTQVVWVGPRPKLQDKTLEECKASCEDNSECVAFEFEPVTKEAAMSGPKESAESWWKRHQASVGTCNGD